MPICIWDQKQVQTDNRQLSMFKEYIRKKNTYTNPLSMLNATYFLSKICGEF